MKVSAFDFKFIRKDLSKGNVGEVGVRGQVLDDGGRPVTTEHGTQRANDDNVPNNILASLLPSALL